MDRMSDRDSPNPQSGTGEAEASPITSSNHTTTSSTSSSPAGKKSRRDLPPLFWYMELGEWEKATQRAKTHPKEVKARATLRTKSSMIDADGTKISGTKRLALHHACFKLRSTGSAPIPQQTTTENTIPEKREVDPFISVCKFILLLLEMFPEACQVRESRHGCLPLHLAAFASCYIRPPSSDDDEQPPKIPASSSSSAGRGHRRSHSAAAAISRHTGASARKPKPNADSANNKQRLSPVPKPNMISNRSSSESTASSNMTAILMEENFAAAQTYRKQEGYGPVTHPNNNNDNNPPLVPAATMTTTQKIFISNKREQWHCRVVNALLDAYPRAIRLDSEGGRLPLHTACAGRATPRVISLLLRSYPAAARHRNKDGFLPLHLAAHWGVSHPNVVITLLKAYPDATVGRNRWERTPLEEALVMAGENGRPHQAPLVRALRKHPNYWTTIPQHLFDMGNLDRPSQEANLVDIDVTLASGDDETSTDDNPKYFNAGHSILLEDGYESVPEGEEACLEHDNKGGIIGRLRRKSHVNDVDITQDLPTLIKNLKWKSVISRLECNPDEANEELVGVMTRGGFQASASYYPLHYACERKPPLEVVQALLEANPEAVTQRMMPGGALPIHAACTWQASPGVISALLSADPITAKVVDELGNRPLHSACFSGASLHIIQDLLLSYPKAVLSRNKQGSQPIDISRRLRHPNRRAVMQELLEKKDYVVQQNHRRSQSSGSMTGLAQQAAKLNATYGTPGNIPSFEQVDENNECLPESGVEVTYEGQDKTQLLWI